MAHERVQRRLAAILAADVVGYGRVLRAYKIGKRSKIIAAGLVNKIPNGRVNHE